MAEIERVLVAVLASPYTDLVMGGVCALIPLGFGFRTPGYHSAWALEHYPHDRVVMSALFTAGFELGALGFIGMALQEIGTGAWQTVARLGVPIGVLGALATLGIWTIVAVTWERTRRLEDG